MSINPIWPNMSCTIVFPFKFLFGWSLHWCKWSIIVLHYYCVTVDFSCVDCLNIYSWYILFLGWFHDHYVVLFLFSCNSLYFKVYFFLIWVLLLQLSFDICFHGILFSTPSLSVVWVPGSRLGLLSTGYIYGSCCTSIQPVCVVWWNHVNYLYLR